MMIVLSEKDLSPSTWMCKVGRFDGLVLEPVKWEIWSWVLVPRT